MKNLKKYFSFSGKATRSEYWAMLALNIVGKIMLSKQCKAHLNDVGETGLHHAGHALKAAIRLQLLVPALIIHSVAPRFFTHTASNVMNDILKLRKKT